MTWYEVFVLILGIIGSLFGILGVTAYINERMKHRASKKNKEEDEEEARKLDEQKRLEQMKHEEYKTELKNIINEALIPIADRLSAIEKDLTLVKGGVQVTCRTDLEELADRAESNGYLSAYDKQRFETTYQKYHDLGKNGVMDAKRDRVLALPEHKPEPKPRKPRTKKVVLVENK